MSSGKSKNGSGPLFIINIKKRASGCCITQQFDAFSVLDFFT
jgi:hypothetical protein